MRPVLSGVIKFTNKLLPVLVHRHDGDAPGLLIDFDAGPEIVPGRLWYALSSASSMASTN